ncbi:hypothetical protein JCM11641_006975 [Rhodosporidiobolus odoratus]
MMQAAVAKAVKAATTSTRPTRAAAVAARSLAANALSQPADRDRASRSPSSSLSPPPPSPPADKEGDYKPSVKKEATPEEEEEKPVVKKKRTRKPKEPIVYVIPDVEHKETNYKGRLGYACLNTILRKQKPPVFCSRTCRIDTIKKEDKGMPYLKELGRQNMEDLKKLIEWNAEHHIYFMRMSSEMFPFAAHPDYQYSLDYAEKELKEAGQTANRLGVRLTTHPGQFTQLGSPRRVVVENAYRDLEYHNEMMDRMGLGKDSVMIIHGGGVYGDKAAAIARFKENYKELSQGVKNRLVLENDEICFNVDDLLPLCEELNIPLVFDYHHDWIFPSSQTPHELLPRILATWSRKGIKPKFHLSEPRKGAETIMERRAHADRCQNLPNPLPEDMDLMIEAKDKEQAVFHLYRIYNLHPTIHDDLRPPALAETKQTARTANKKKTPKKEKKGDAKKKGVKTEEDEGDTAGTDDTATTATTAGLGETDGTADEGGEGEGGAELPPSPRAAAVELANESQGEQVMHAVKEGMMPLPEGLDAEGQEYCPEANVKEGKGKGKGKKAIKADGAEKVTPKKRARAPLKKVKTEDEQEDGEEKPKKKRKTPVKKAQKVEGTTGESAQDTAGEDEKPKQKRKTPVQVKKEDNVEPAAEGMEAVAMEVAKE